MPKGKDKGMLAILMGGKKDEEGDAPEKEGEDYSEDLEMAAEDLLGALEKKDAAGVASAFRAMHDICANG